jgi:hypothetical protein
MPLLSVNLHSATVTFNELEQHVLRHLQEEFLKKGSRPRTMHDPAIMHQDVMQKFALDLPQYREVMARLEQRGIVRAIAIGTSYGHLQVNPIVVEIVRQIDEHRPPANEAKVGPEDVPAELRELGLPDGAILTATYLAKNLDWNFSSPELSKAYEAGVLTYRLKVGNQYAYRYTELCKLRVRRADREDAG